MFGAIASAVAGPLVSGLFSSRRSKQQTSNEIDYVKLRDNAQKAGFNPLTALRQGAGGFTTTTGPQLSSRDFIADALGKGVETFFNREDNQLDREIDELKKKNLQMELQERQKRIEQPLGPQTFGYSIPQVVTATREEQGVQPPLGIEPGRRTNTNVNHGADTNYLDPSVVDAEMAEARYGDVAQEFAGARNIYKDNRYNARLQKLKVTHGKAVAEAVHKEYSADPTKNLSDVIRRHKKQPKRINGFGPSVPRLSVPTPDWAAINDYDERNRVYPYGL